MSFDLMYIVEIVLFGLAFVVGVVNLILLIENRAWNKDLMEYLGYIHDSHKAIMNWYQNTSEIFKIHQNIYKEVLQSHDLIMKDYDVIAERIEGLATAYGDITKQHKKLLTTWGKIEEGYSQSADQYMQTTKDLRDYKALLEKVLMPADIGNYLNKDDVLLNVAEPEIELKAEPEPEVKPAAKKRTARKKKQSEPTAYDLMTPEEQEAVKGYIEMAMREVEA